MNDLTKGADPTVETSAEAIRLPSTLELQIDAIETAMSFALTARLATDIEGDARPSLKTLLRSTSENKLTTRGRKFVVEWANPVSTWLQQHGDKDTLTYEHISAFAEALTNDPTQYDKKPFDAQIYETLSPTLLIGLLPNGELVKKFVVDYLESQSPRPDARLNSVVASTVDAAKTGRGDIAARIVQRTLTHASTNELRNSAALSLRLAVGRLFEPSSLDAARSRGDVSLHINGILNYLDAYAALPGDQGQVFVASELARGVANTLAAGEYGVFDYLDDPSKLSHLTYHADNWPLELATATLRVAAEQPVMSRDATRKDLVNFLITNFPDQIPEAINDTHRARERRDLRDLTIAFVQNTKSPIEAIRILCKEFEIDVMPMTDVCRTARAITAIGLTDIATDMLFDAYLKTNSRIAVISALDDITTTDPRIQSLCSEVEAALETLVVIFDRAREPSPLEWLSDEATIRHNYEGVVKILEVFATIGPRHHKPFANRADQIALLAGSMRLDGFDGLADRATNIEVLSALGIAANEVEFLRARTESYKQGKTVDIADKL